MHWLTVGVKLTLPEIEAIIPISVSISTRQLISRAGFAGVILLFLALMVCAASAARRSPDSMALKRTSSYRPSNPAGIAGGSGDTQQETAAKAAAKWHVSGQTLWGIYGTESGFGSNLGPSSAGALGPMQFLLSTGQQYGLNIKTIMELAPSMEAAAHYLHDLGADNSPTSPKTIAALNAYNGNGGGTSETSYSASVLKYGKEFNSSAPNDAAYEPETEGEGKTADAGLIGESATILKDVLTGNVSDLASHFALMGLSLIKDVALGAFDFIWQPAWHWNQRTIAYYNKEMLNPKNSGNGTPNQWAFLWTAVFWGGGYAILWGDAENGSLKPASAKKARLARHIRTLQAVPARRDLIKPKHVKERTPQKPTPRSSRIPIELTTTMRAQRPRIVRVTDANRREPQTTAPKANGDTTSQANVEQTEHAKTSQPNTPPNPGPGARQDR